MPDQPRTDAAARELLIEDYKQLGESLWNNEQVGETRVNWFMTIVAAVAAGLVSLGSAQHGLRGETLRLITVNALGALFVVGIVTLFRLIKRNAKTDGFKQDRADVRQIFKDQFDPHQILTDYYPYAPKPKYFKDKSKRKRKKSKVSVRGPGSLAHFVAVINALLGAGVAGAAAFPIAADAPRLTWVYVWIAITFVVLLAAQIALVTWLELCSRRKLERSRVNRAGGVVFRAADQAYLLVDSQEEPKRRVLPKGKVKKHEGHIEAALREVREESGVVARPICPLGIARYEHNGEAMSVKYYLMEFLDQVDSAEGRKPDWHSLDDALRQLRHAELRPLMREAERRRAAMPKVPAPSPQGAEK